MLIHPWYAAVDDEEWRAWLNVHERFGVLAVNNQDRAHAPLVLPLHFTIVGNEILLHLAHSNPVWPHVEVAEEVRLSVHGDYAFIPGYWRAKAGAPEEDGVPTSYYVAVQFVCRPTIVDDPDRKADILMAQLADFQPEGRHGPVATGSPPYGSMLAAIRGMRLQVLRVDAKFKYDEAKPLEHRERVAQNLDERNRGLDLAAAVQQRRRLEAVGEWGNRRGDRSSSSAEQR